MPPRQQIPSCEQRRIICHSEPLPASTLSEVTEAREPRALFWGLKGGSKNLKPEALSCSDRPNLHTCECLCRGYECSG